MASRLAVVTGANQGIGREIAAALGTTPNVSVILTARDVERGEAAARELQAAGCKVSFFPLDITSQPSVDALAQHIRTHHAGLLDILVNNAGTAYKGDVFGAAEARATMDVNLSGTLRVTNALLPFLKAAAKAQPTHNTRIVNVCSQAGRLGQVSPPLQASFQETSTIEQVVALSNAFCDAVEDGSYAAKGWPRSMYGVSKLCEIAATFVLARNLVHEGVEVQACCPGWCSTSMSSFKGPRSAAQGAETPVFLALGMPDEEAVPLAQRTGGFWFDKHLIAW